MKPLKALIPLDGSPFSAQVLPAVCRLLDPDTCHLTLVRVAPLPLEVTPVPSPPHPVTLDGWTTFDGYDSAWARDLAEHPGYASQVWEGVRQELADGLADELRCLKQAGFTVSLSVHFGDAADELVRLTEAGAFDLVVMATHGRGGVRRALVGSVAETVLKRGSLPVLMLKPAQQPARTT